ncbi:MAG TPA: uracil phosphoribosyltransferase [Planctomycetota bacterium]|nr:uracil phosphoribosyltransferase [Planctomycetota bacterium]
MSLVRSAYTGLAQLAFAMHLPTVQQRVATRMAEQHGEQGYWVGRGLDPSASIVVLDVIRGGIVPAQVCFELLTAVLPVDNLRLDHVNMARVAGPDGHVSGVDLSGSKIGGRLDGATLIVPDPMGATGSTLVRALEYLAEHHGTPAKVVALPLISTPEFLRATLPAHPNLHVVAGRLDRGMSPPEVLASVPGSSWEREKGLDEHDYIVPGAGGVGEVLNNSWC